MNHLRNHRNQDYVLLTCIGVVIILTILYGGLMAKHGIAIRQWPWSMVWYMLPLVPLAFMQPLAGLPPLSGYRVPGAWWKNPWFAGILFGLLDVLVIKVIMHPEPYTEMPPFLQPFPYSIFLYASGATETELYYRLLPVTILFFLQKKIFNSRGRKELVIFLAMATSLVEPIMQWPSGPAWYIIYALISGIAMNALQFYFLLNHGFFKALSVRLGHYLIWHILLGIYVEFIELA